MSFTVRLELPAHLRLLSGVKSEVALSLEAPITQRSVLNALEATYPMLEGTIRDHGSKIRRPFIRFFASREDISHQSPDEKLPDAITQGTEPLLIVAAIAGG